MKNSNFDNLSWSWPESLVRAPHRSYHNHPAHYHIANQIVITGRPAEIDAVIADTLIDLPSISPQAALSATAFDAIKIDELFPTPADARLAPFAGLEIRLYSMQAIESEQHVWQVVKLIYKHAAQHGVIVFADPYLIAGNPVAGGSGGTGGGPVNLPLGINEPQEIGKKKSVPKSERLEPGQVYREHWAFGPATGTYRGINLEKIPGQALSAQTGAGARVFILDTVDPDLAGSGAGLGSIDQSAQVIVMRRFKDAVLDFDLRVTRLPAADLAPDTLPQDNVHEHGLYVAGLINRVAPGADLHLVQVLNEYGKGELFTLAGVLGAIAAYAMQRPAEADLPLSDVVINMSLEANFSENLMLSLGVRDALLELWAKTRHKVNESDVLFGLLRDIVNGFSYIPSVRLPIQILHSLGAVLVSSAGNESSDYFGHLPMAIPARYKEVIGAASSNYQGNLSSFSNQGDILAPGGGLDGGDDPTKEIRHIPIQRRQDLVRYTMVSVVPESEQPEGLAFWWGTSFSAPLVSGLAALLQAEHRQVYGCGPHPAALEKWICDNAANGVIDVQAALACIQAAEKS